MPAPLIVTIPRYFSGHTMTSITRQIVDGAQNGELASSFRFDFGNLDFIQPAGIVFLSNLVHWLREKARPVEFFGLDGASRPIRYLDDSQFFAIHCGQRLDASAEPRPTTIPYTQVTQTDSHGWLDGRFVPWLCGRLEQTAATLAPLRTCASELFNNIADHTRYDIGGICAQHFPQANRVEIAVADFGVGIPSTVRRVRAGLTDGEAILEACRDGFTSQSTPRNRGAGLDYLLRVVGANSGTLSIFSGSAIVSFEPDENGSMVSAVSQSIGFCPGTLIQIMFRTDQLVPVPDEEEVFEW